MADDIGLLVHQPRMFELVSGPFCHGKLASCLEPGLDGPDKDKETQCMYALGAALSQPWWQLHTTTLQLGFSTSTIVARQTVNLDFGQEATTGAGAGLPCAET